MVGVCEEEASANGGILIWIMPRLKGGAGTSALEREPETSL